jgi:chromosome segregation ATPase
VDFAELQEQQVEHLGVMVERRFLDEAVAEGERLRARVEALTGSQTTLQRRVDELSLVSESHARDDSDAAYDPHALVEVCTERDLLLIELDNQNRQHSADIANLQQQIDELEAQAQLDLQTQIEEVEERAQLQANEANQRIRELEGQLRAVLSMGPHAEQ